MSFSPGGAEGMQLTQNGLNSVWVNWYPTSGLIYIQGHIYYQRIGTNRIDNRTISWWYNYNYVQISGLIGGATYSIYLAQTESNPNTVKAIDTLYIGIMSPTSPIPHINLYLCAYFFCRASLHLYHTVPSIFSLIWKHCQPHLFPHPPQRSDWHSRVSVGGA